MRGEWRGEENERLPSIAPFRYPPQLPRPATNESGFRCGMSGLVSVTNGRPTRRPYQERVTLKVVPAFLGQINLP